ncbi:MAG: hypothetical protein PHW76_03420 [Alphaproteobacteria bacterium]|nr:hypothetical protein [Alphaproteobacteria bacterium]
MMQVAMQHRLCVMLAFQAIITNGKKTDAPGVETRVIELAKHMNEFCNRHVREAFPIGTINLVDDKGAAKIDEAIDQYIQELRTKEQTHLPEDRETLIQLYDRLQQRRSRRMQWEFYATAKEDKLSYLIIKYLDEEIEDLGGVARQ